MDPVPLTPILSNPGSPEFDDILAWRFPAEPFYLGQVGRLLRSDIPRRARYGGSVWTYRDPDGATVGFGAFHVWDEYGHLAGGRRHPYIPLLAVNPQVKSRGHGQSIVAHLTAEAYLAARAEVDVAEQLFLDVYTVNQRAIDLYRRCGFAVVDPQETYTDPNEGDAPFLIMVRNVAPAPP